MKTFPRYTAAVIVALGLAGAVGAARANPMMDPGRMAAMCGDMDARMAGRMAFAEAKLGLSDAQKAGFKTLAETMKAAGEPMRKACADQTAQAAATTLPARMEGMQKMMTARTEAMAKVLPAMTRFYNTLTPDQQKVADSMMMGGHHGGGMGGGRGPMMGH
ncbi:MAG: hypothetical protein EPN20_17705 [Magnetospirillum sp.]|nr:MAG: hypothetical protein EPN20_17705 [Magnetospirillum sp.]